MVTYSSCDDVLPTFVNFQSTGGSKFSTAVVVTGGGQEQRIEQWDEDLGQWDIAYGIVSLAEIQLVREFANARRGMAQGFCFFFHEDFEAKGMEIGVGDGTEQVFQLVKLYFGGIPEWQPNTPYTNIVTLKPTRKEGDRVRPTVYAGQIFACIQAGTSDNAEPTWDPAIGAITTETNVKWSTLRGPDVYVKTIAKPIPGSVIVYFDGVQQVEGTNYTANYSTGEVTATVGADVEVTADFQFYHKARFANDHMPIQQDLKNGGSIRSIPLVELRPDEG